MPGTVLDIKDIMVNKIWVPVLRLMMTVRDRQENWLLPISVVNARMG